MDWVVFPSGYRFSSESMIRRKAPSSATGKELIKLPDVSE